MTERRAHWTDDLIEAVAAVINQADVDDYANVHFTHSDIYKIIAAVEDWQRENLHWPRTVETCEQAERLRSESDAAIQRVRELCERQSFRATAEGYCVVMRVVETREVLRVLDGEQ